MDLEGVEFKCLPSGLHSVKEDVVYFVQGACAGVSVFVHEEADAQHRNANFAAVGTLVPLSYGRIGRGWVLAPELRRLASDVVKKSSGQDTQPLEAFWEKHRQDENAKDTAPASPSISRDTLPESLDRRRSRARSDVTGGLTSDQSIGNDHPALCMPELLDTFGPLVFPMFRAELLRKRILLLGQPPVQSTCNFIYILSVLANIPSSLREILHADLETALRIQSLFNVGISDIPSLSTGQTEGEGWLACTSDDILRDKHQLYDLLVTMPGPHLNPAKHRWPTITTSSGAPVKATQRDLRRYRLLRSELNRIRLERERYRDHPSSDNSQTDATDGGEGVPLIPTATILNDVRASPDSTDDSQVVEPTSWTAMAYTGFLWWASAGEMEAWESEEARADRALLDDLPELDMLMEATSPSASRTSFSHAQDEDERSKERHKARATATVVTAYFHRLTHQILSAMAEVVETADDETEEGVADEGIIVSGEEMKTMGLDTWSEADRTFVSEAMKLWFRRDGSVERGGTRICGVRIC